MVTATLTSSVGIVEGKAINVFIGNGVWHGDGALDPQSVAIVRWRVGEEDIWLRVSQSSSNWIEYLPTSTLQAPSPSLGVSFSFGVPAASSWAVNQLLFPVGYANMRANSRLPDPLSLVDAEDTLLVIDLRQSIDLPFPDLSSEVITDYLAFTDCLGVTTEPDPTDIAIGPQTPVTFAGDRGRSRIRFVVPNQYVAAPGCQRSRKTFGELKPSGKKWIQS